MEDSLREIRNRILAFHQQQSMVQKKIPHRKMYKKEQHTHIFTFLCRTPTSVIVQQLLHCGHVFEEKKAWTLYFALKIFVSIFAQHHLFQQALSLKL